METKELVDKVREHITESVFNSMVETFREFSQKIGKKPTRKRFHTIIAFVGVFNEYADALYDYIWPWHIDYTKKGIFKTHRCVVCNDGAKLCVEGNNGCSNLRARND